MRLLSLDGFILNWSAAAVAYLRRWISIICVPCRVSVDLLGTGRCGCGRMTSFGDREYSKKLVRGGFAGGVGLAGFGNASASRMPGTVASPTPTVGMIDDSITVIRTPSGCAKPHCKR